MRCKACDRLLSDHEPDNELCNVCYNHVIGMYDDNYDVIVDRDVDEGFDETEIPL